jgi:hypothetical protein
MIVRLGAVLLVLATGLGVRALTDGWFAKYAGVALYATLLYTLVVLVLPRARPTTAGLIALGLSWIVEFAQLTAVPATLSRVHPLLRLVFGATFSLADLPAYAVGALVGVAVHQALRRSRPS